MPKVHVEPLDVGNAVGVSAEWEGCQFVVIVCQKGLVGCGVIDPVVMERAGAAVAVSRGTPEKQLKTPEDLLGARIMAVTAKAREMGIVEGMTGRDAVTKLSSA